MFAPNSEQLETIKRLEEEVKAKTADLTKLSEDLEQQRKKNNVSLSRSSHRNNTKKVKIKTLVPVKWNV